MIPPKKRPGPKPGSPKTGGRQKGSSNATTIQRREKINLIIDLLLLNVPDYLDQINTKDKISFLLQLLPYSLGKVAQLEPVAADDPNQPPRRVFTLEIDPSNPSQLAITRAKQMLEEAAKEKEEVVAEEKSEEDG